MNTWMRPGSRGTVTPKIAMSVAIQLLGVLQADGVDIQEFEMARAGDAFVYRVTIDGPEGRPFEAALARPGDGFLEIFSAISAFTQKIRQEA